MHAPSPEKDEAEELAKLHADGFGAELLDQRETPICNLKGPASWGFSRGVR